MKAIITSVLLAAAFSAAQGQYFVLEEILYEDNVQDFQLSREYQSATEIFGTDNENWQTDLLTAEAMAQAQAATSTTTSASFGADFRVLASATVQKNMGGNIYRVDATWGSEDVQFTIDLSSYSNDVGYVSAVFVWPMAADSIWNKDVSLIAIENPSVILKRLPTEQQSVLEFEFIPWWPNNLVYAHLKGTAGFVGSTQPKIVLLKQTEEAPSSCLISDANVGNPINVVTGNKHLEMTDISVPTPGLPLQLHRRYNSLSTNGWTHNYQIRLEDRETVFQGTTNNWKVLVSGPASLHFKEIQAGTNVIYESPLGTSYGLDVLTNDQIRILMDAGQSMSFLTNGLVSVITDDFGNRIDMTYTNDAVAGEVLAAATHNSGPALTYSYVSGRLDRVDSPSTNLYLDFDYDTNGWIRAAALVLDDTTQTTTYAYQASVDGSGYNLIAYTNAIGTPFNYTYLTNQSSQVTSQGTSTSVGTSEYMKVTVEYPTNSPFSRTVTFDRDTETLEYQYLVHPVFNRLEAVVGPNTTNEVLRRESRFEYDAFGNRDAEVYADWTLGEWTRSEYDFNGDHQVTNAAFGYMTEDPSNFWGYTWNSSFNTVASITDPEDHSIEFDYTNGLIQTVGLMVDSTSSYETAYYYTTNGLLSAVSNANGHGDAYTQDSYGYPNLITPELGPEIDLDHNILGHLETITLPGAAGDRIIELDPDPLGRVGEINYPNSLSETFVYDAVDNLLTNVDTAGRTTRYTYLPLGTISSVTRELVTGTSTQDVTIAFAYDQQFNSLQIINPLGQVVEAYDLDELDRPTTVTNVDDQDMTIDYGVGEYVNSVTRFDQSVVLYDYNSDGLMSDVIYDDDTNSFTYFRNDLLRTAANGIASLSNDFNTVNRVTQTVTQASGFTSEVTYAYAPAGQVTNMASVAGNVGYVYDAAERLNDLNDSVAGVFDFTYNAYNGLVETLDYPNGIDCTFQYDIMDRLLGISYTLGGSTVESIDYGYNDATGMITNRLRESSIGEFSIGYGYDSLDRLTAETLRNTTGGVVDASTYDYDLAGNRTDKTRNDLAVEYDLGTGNRLSSWEITTTGTLETVLSVGGISTETIGVDPRFGERTINDLEAEAAGTNYWRVTVPVSTGSVDIVAAIGDVAGNVSTVTNAITVSIITNAVYAHDPAGNLTNILFNGGAKTNSLTWNEQYQLLSVSTNGGLVESYTYDVFGRRLTTTLGSDTMVHMYSGIHCIADTDTNGVPLTTYTYGPGIDNPLTMTVHESAETNTYYYLTDHLGSVLALTDDNGAVVETYDYDGWGRTTVFDAGGTPLAESAYGNRITFQGREHSWATGLTYFRARWYDPVTGRWLSKDPIGISGGLNQYVAFGNNPVVFLDPHGLDLIPGDEKTKQGIAALEKSGSAKVQKMIEVLKESPNSHHVGTTEGRSHSRPANLARISDKVGTSSRNYWNPDGHNGFSGNSVLAHELCHALQFDQGKYDPSDDNKDGVKRSEEQATTVGNLYRRAVGEVLRSGYKDRNSDPKKMDPEPPLLRTLKK